MATVSKGSKAPEGDLTYTPAVGEQFTVGDDSTFETQDEALLASLSAEVAADVLKIDRTADVDAEAKARAEEAKETEKQARERARQIKRGVPAEELTVPGDPAETPTTPVDDGGGNS